MSTDDETTLCEGETLTYFNVAKIDFMDDVTHTVTGKPKIFDLITKSQPHCTAPSNSGREDSAYWLIAVAVGVSVAIGVAAISKSIAAPPPAAPTSLPTVPAAVAAAATSAASRTDPQELQRL